MAGRKSVDEELIIDIRPMNAGILITIAGIATHELVRIIESVLSQFS